MECKDINLKKGSKGDNVKELQRKLTELGYYDGKIDGDFGSYTETSVKSFQKASKGLAVDGVVGSVTCNKLQSAKPDPKEETMKKGSKGSNVKTLQEKLKQLGYYNAEVDGDFGNKTVNAVKQYQTYYNLVSDGVCGPLTQKVLSETRTLNETTNSKKLSKALGVTIKDHGTLYQGVIKKGKYSYYNNDIYTYSQEITKVCNGSGINCTDWAQTGMQLLLEMGYPKDNLRIVRGVVTCNSGKAFGHVWLQLYLNGKWVNYDLSAAAAHGYEMPRLICTRGYNITNINPAWAVSDDGIT